MEDNQPKTSSIFIAAMVVVCLILIWLAGHKYIAGLFVFFRKIEMLIPALISDSANMTLLRLRSTDASMLTFSGMFRAMFASGIYVAVMFVIPAIWITYVLYQRDKVCKLKKKHTIRTLFNQESKIWKTITPATKLNIVNEPATSGPWASAMTEREFAKFHKLIDIVESTDGEGNLVSNEVLNKNRAKIVFMRQLGPRLGSVYRMQPHVKGVFACLAAKVAGIKEGKQELADLLSDRMAVEWSPKKKMDFSWADAEIKKSIDHPLVKLAISRHAYVYTLMAMMMQLARNGESPGVFASSQFKWLRTMDRSLWYTLNNVGRTAYHVECAGIISHWLAEKAVGFKILPPQVDNAVSYSTEVFDDYQGKNVTKVLGGLEMELMNYIDEDREAALMA